MQDISFLAR